LLIQQTLIKSIPDKKEIYQQHAFVIESLLGKAGELVDIKKCLRWIGWSSRQHYHWIKCDDCLDSLLGLCRKKHPFQLLKKELQVIKEYLLNPAYQHFSAASVYCQMLRDNALHISKSTFCKYKRLLKIDRKRMLKRPSKNTVGIRATKALSILHMDVCVYKTNDNRKAYIYIVQDNFSRAILGIKTSLKCCSEIAKENLLEVISKHNLYNKELSLITDDGMENKGAVTELLKGSGLLIKQIIAQVDIELSNSMVEACNKIVKYQFLYRKDIEDFNALEKYIETVRDNFNNMPLLILHALTPQEVLDGQLPDSNFFKIGIATQNRKLANQLFNCSDLCKVKRNGSF
jgi:putative transposase